MNVYDCFAFTGQFKLIKKDTIAFQAGNTICKWNLEKNKKKFIQSERNGFQCFTVNHRKKIIVTAEYGQNPTVTVYIGDQHFQLNGVSPLEILQMDISQCGRYLLVVVGVPKFEICIWDLQEKQRLKGKHSQLPLKMNFLEARFMVLGERILVKYEKKILLYKIVPFFEYENQEVLKNIKLELVESYELDQKTEIVQDYNYILDSRSSYEENNLYLVQNNVIIYLNGETLQEITRYECHSAIKHLVITQVHLIVVYSQSKFEWLFKYVSTNVNDQATLPFKLDKKYNHIDRGEIKQIMYNQDFTKLICSTEDASLIILPVAGESIQGEEDPQADPQDEDKIMDLTHEIEFVKLGPFQKGAITFIKEFQQNFVVVCGCDSGKVVFWDVIGKNTLSSFNAKCSITCGDLNESTLIVGSNKGVIRIYNVGDIRNPVLYKLIRLYNDKAITQIVTQDQLTAVSCNESQQVFFFQQDSMLGYVELPFNCQGIAWSSNNLLLCLSQFLLLSIQAPKQNQASLKLELQIMGRKIDPDQQLIICTQFGDVITTGKDKVFKKYKYPEEVLSKMDLKMRVANQGPIEEQDGHNLVATCFTIKDYLYSGSKDGTIMIRSSDKLSQDIRMFKSHNLKCGGVSTLCVSNKMKMLYSGGFDGEMFWWAGEKVKGESDAILLMKNNYSAPPDIGDQFDDDVKYYQQVLEIEYFEQQAPVREQQKRQTKDVLKQISHKLNALLQENEQADELERLGRDEFVIDLQARDNILEEGQKQKQALREKVKKENTKQEILFNMIKERTWDQMEVPLKGLNGLTQNIIVINFHIRVRTNDEIRKLKIVRELRKQELKELKLRQTTNIKEVWSIEEQIVDPKYIINAKPGQPTLVFNDYEKKEDPAPAKVVAKQAGPQGKQPATNVRGVKVRQQQQLAQQKQQEEEKKREEEEKQKEKERQQQLQQQKQEEKKDGEEEYSEWDYLYGVQELFTTNRKRNQMILLNDVIYNIKRQFNAEFETVLKLRHNQMDNIKERNKRISEINAELKRENTLFQCKKNILEDPEKILRVENTEIPFEKYETKEMRDKKEAERLKEEARLKALAADDSGIRAVKDMMGGTLEEKKDTPLDEKLEMEEWMKKNPDDMTEDEKMKLKEFEVKKARLEEEKEKIRKNLEAELKKLNIEITDICTRFDDRLLVLFRRRLEFDYRILEQELIIVRLALSIILQQQGQIKMVELEQLSQELTIKLQNVKEMKESLDTMKDQTFNQKKQLFDQLTNYFTAQRIQYPQGYNANNVKSHWQNIFEVTNEKQKQENDEKLLSNPKFKNVLIHADPYFENQKVLVTRQFTEQFDSFVPILTDKLKGDTQALENFDHVKDFFLQMFGQRFKLKQDYERSDREFQDLDLFCKGFDSEYQSYEINLQTAQEDEIGIQAMLEKSKSNIEVLLRFRQGYVEISQDKPVPNLSEAVLMPREALESKNSEIRKQGDIKIQLMEEIKKIKFDVAKSEYELLRRDLIIQDLECKTREVQLLKVKKEMQIALTKDDTRLNEKELANLKDQIDLLKSATEKRLQIINKKKEKIEKDIDFIRKENSQLIGQGSVLSGNVKQLQEISDMQNKKNVKQGEEAQEPQEEKFTQIARNHKLFHEAKRQAEEIEILRDELSKLKARTFANFQNNVSR